MNTYSDTYTWSSSNQFKRDVKRCQKQGKNMRDFDRVHQLLIKGEPLPVQLRNHVLTGNWKGHYECHLKPDWLLIYQVNDSEKEITYVRMGSHSELFG
jgi:mRNA interferase YafQ